MSFEQLFSSGHIVDIILIVIVLEGIFLSALYYLKGIGFKPVNFILHSLPGVFIFLALRSALVGKEWPLLAIFLSLSFLAHVLDLVFLSKKK